MIPGSAVGAIHRLAWADTEAEARDLIVEAIRRGADPVEAAEALELWRRVREESQRRISRATEAE